MSENWSLVNPDHDCCWEIIIARASLSFNSLCTRILLDQAIKIMMRICKVKNWVSEVSLDASL